MTSSRGKRTSNPTGKVVKVVAARVGHRRSALTGRFIRTNASQNPRVLIADMHGVRGQPRVAGTSEWDRFEDRIVQELRRELHLQLRRAAVADIDIAAMGDPQDIAAAMVAVLPASHPFDEVIGPFYDTPGLTQWLQITRPDFADASFATGCGKNDSLMFERTFLPVAGMPNSRPCPTTIMEFSLYHRPIRAVRWRRRRR